MSGKGFFAMSVAVLHKIIDQGGDASDLMAYMVLAKHTSGWGKWKYTLSTAGAKAVSSKTGLTFRQAQVRLDWLKDKGFIQSGDDVRDMPEYVTDEVTHQRQVTKVRWVLGERLGTNRVYLSHALVDGVGGGKNRPPLIRLWNEVIMRKCPKIIDARTDALLLLIHCYTEQSIEDYGGINPSVLYTAWPVAEENINSFEGNETVVPIEEGDTIASKEFQCVVLPHVPESERNERFWGAYRNLLRLGFLYEVLEVWRDNPLNNPRAELFYPLYVRDRHARKSEPYCQKEIHNYLAATWMEEYSEFNEMIDEAQQAKQFRLIKSRGDNECVIGIYRLKFRPHTEDTGRGMAKENDRAESWKLELKQASDEAKLSW